MHWGEHQENEALVYTNETTFVLLIKCIANMVQNIWTIVIKQMCIKFNFSSSAFLISMELPYSKCYKVFYRLL